MLQNHSSVVSNDGASVEIIRAIFKYYNMLFSNTTTCSSFKWIEPLLFEISCTQTHGKTERHADTQMDMSTL